ncbi:MAG: hypothetical protein ACKO11_10425 [Cuspidothrix sp.]
MASLRFAIRSLRTQWGRGRKEDDDDFFSLPLIPIRPVVKIT